MVQVKGTVILDTFSEVRTRGGEGQLNRIFAQMDEDGRKVLQGAIAPSSWYPLDNFIQFLETDIRETANGDETALIERSEKVIEKQLQGVNKVFVRLGSPEFVINRIAAMQATCFTGVRIETRMSSKRSALIRYEGFERQHRILGYAIIGFFRKALEISGAKNIEAHYDTPIEAGTGICILELRWA